MTDKFDPKKHFLVPHVVPGKMARICKTRLSFGMCFLSPEGEKVWCNKYKRNHFSGYNDEGHAVYKNSYSCMWENSEYSYSYLEYYKRAPEHDLIPRATADKLAEALDFYADKSNLNSVGGYVTSQGNIDNGGTAREALTEYRKDTE